MSAKKDTGGEDRRGFLKLLGLGAVTGGAALTAVQRPAEAREATSEKGGLYRETELVRTYYETTRF